MANTYGSKLKLSSVSYILLSVVLTYTILVSVSEQHAYAKGPMYSAEHNFNQFLVVVFMPLVLGSGLLLIAIIARRSFPITADH